MSNVSSCPSSVKPCRRRSKVGYRVRNWPDYDAGLQQRGSLTVWFTPQAVEAWYYQGPPQRGAQYTFSDGAIQTALTLRLLTWRWRCLHSPRINPCTWSSTRRG